MIKRFFRSIKHFWVYFSGIWFYRVRKLPIGTHLEYFLLYRVGIKIEVVMDVGANIGSFSKRLGEFFPNANFYCFEPFEKTFEILEKNLPNKKFHLNQFALGERIYSLLIYPNSIHHSDLNSIFNTDKRDSNAIPEKIEITTVDQFLSESNLDAVDFLKIDTEGFDLKVLEGSIESL